MDIESRLVNKRYFHVHLTIMEDEYYRARFNELGYNDFRNELASIVMQEIQRQLKIIDKNKDKEL